MARTGPGVLDALSLLAQVSDELVVGTVRDTHTAWLDRFRGGPLHRSVAGGVYAGIGAGLRGNAKTARRIASCRTSVRSSYSARATSSLLAPLRARAAR